MNDDNLILTIDLGTSGPKVSLFDFHAKTIGYEFLETRTIFTPDGGVEQDPYEWIQAIEKCYFALIEKTKINTQAIKAINVTSQWSGTVAIDSNKKPLYNAIIWMDDRGAPFIKKRVEGLINIEGYAALKLLKWINITGGMPSLSGKDSVAHILFIKEKLADIYQRTYKFLEPKDFINLYLSDKIATSADTSTLHWITDNRDINNIKYHAGLAAELSIDLKKLPDILPANSILGTVSESISKKWNLSPTTQLVIGTPDTHSAAIGSGAVNDFEGHLYYGTSSWLLTHFPTKKTDIFNNMATIPSAIPGRYLLANEQESAGTNLNFLKNNIFFPKDKVSTANAPANFYQLLDEMIADKAPGSNGLFFLPWLNGERSPIDNHKARGGFYNLALKHTRADLVQAVFEGVGMNSKWLLDAVEKNCKKPFEVINFIGGGANSAVWCQILANIFDRKIAQVAEPVSANSRGAALLALLAIGQIKQNEIKNLVTIKQIFSPNKESVAYYKDRFVLFKAIYKKNVGIFNKIN